MESQQYLSTLSCLPLPSGNLQTPSQSIPWCYLPISSSVFLSFLLLSLSPAFAMPEDLKGLDPSLDFCCQGPALIGKVDKISVYINLTLEASEMFLSLHMIFSLERAAVVWAILERISVLILRWRWLLQGTWSSPVLLASVICKVVISHPPMLTLPSWSSNASHTILSMKMLKRVGESKHPCRTPTVVLNHSPVLPLKRTALWALSYRLSKAHMMLALMLYFLTVAHSGFCHEVAQMWFYHRVMSPTGADRMAHIV